MTHDKPHTIEARQKISTALSNAEKSGRPIGVPVSQETREKMRAAKIGHKENKLKTYVTKLKFHEIFPDINLTYGKGYQAIDDNKKIDIKGSCLSKITNDWRFGIRQNKDCDIFALMAFDNAQDQNLVHLWMMPAELLRNKSMLAVSEGSKIKIDKYEIDLEI